MRIFNDPKTDLKALNYGAMVSRIKNTLNPWQRYGLTPYGRIHVIKSELLSQLVYMMTVLPAPEKAFCKDIEKTMFKFIWGGKQDKIKRATLKSKYKDGGLQVPDIEKQASSLKATWVKKYLDQGNSAKWKSVMRERLTICEGICVFHCTPSIQQMNARGLSKFWIETCECWCVVIGLEQTKAEVLLNQTIVMNKFIDVEKNSTINARRLVNKGIKRIVDIYSMQERRLLNANEIGQKFGIHPMSAASILGSIPKPWKDVLMKSRPTSIEEAEGMQKVNQIHKIASFSYSGALNRTEDTIEKCHAKWNTELAMDVIDWENVYRRLYASTKDIQLRWFQCRCIKRILPTNKMLTLYKISENENCRECPNHVENMTHLLWHCPKVRQLWRELKSLMSLPVVLTISDAILGIGNGVDGIKQQQHNILLILAKYFIWVCRAKNETVRAKYFYANI